MGIFDGGIFDFDGDGKMSSDEIVMGLLIMDDMEREEAREQRAIFGDDDEFDDEFDDEYDL